MAMERPDVLAKLQELLREVWRDHPGGDVEASAALKDIGVQSSSMLTFLVRAEQDFAFKWDPDLPAGALRSLDTIADAVRDLLISTASGRG